MATITIVGSARSSYGNTNPGDQSGGKEVSTQNWYLHSKGWRVFVCTIPGAGPYIADAMKKACANNDIGYSQGSRNTLYNNIKSKGFDPSETTKPVNTDCSALVRVCVQYAFNKLGISKTVPDFITSGEANTLLKTGYFKELTGESYTKTGKNLPTGAILVTKTKGHTVVVTQGVKIPGEEIQEKPFNLGDRILKNGNEGSDVKELQEYLIQLGYDLGSWGADGDFGDATEMAVKLFQTNEGIEIDGEVGKETLSALKSALLALEEESEQFKIKIVNGNCYIREQPTTESKSVGVAKKGTIYNLLAVSDNGWHQTNKGWVSGKYSERI